VLGALFPAAPPSPRATQTAPSFGRTSRWRRPGEKRCQSFARESIVVDCLFPKGGQCGVAREGWIASAIQGRPRRGPRRGVRSGTSVTHHSRDMGNTLREVQVPSPPGGEGT
jgi:hypothetical protein